jgi:type IV pilus assembly protein PilC
MELVARLRTALWRAASYPFVILVGLLLVVLFLVGYLLPQFREMYRTFANFGVPPPRLTRFLLDISQGVSIAVIVLLIGLIAIPILWLLLGALGLGPRLMDRLVLPLPLVGPILRWNLVARWCDALDLAVHAGLDLPASVDLAADAVDSPRLRRDSDQLIQTLQSGQPLDSRQSYGLLPPLVPASMQAGSRTGDLPATLATLSQMYQQQAELRLGTLPTVLAPLLMVVVALLIALVMAATLVPIISLFHGISGGW